MIECKKHKAKITESTCIARQAVIAKVEKINSQPGKTAKGLLAANYNNYNHQKNNRDSPKY